MVFKVITTPIVGFVATPRKRRPKPIVVVSTKNDKAETELAANEGSSDVLF